MLGREPPPELSRIHLQALIERNVVRKLPLARVARRDRAIRSKRDAIVDFARRSLPNADEWIDRIDFDTLQPMATETVDEAFRSRFNDMVWRLRFRDRGQDAEWLYVIVMLEFPSTVDWLMALRVQSYTVRIYESIPFVKSPNSATRLPPVLAIVVYNGRRPWRAARRLSDVPPALASDRIANPLPKMLRWIRQDRAVAHRTDACA